MPEQILSKGMEPPQGSEGRTLILLPRSHVRVNHSEKDMSDPQLREVLVQRCEGGN